MEFHLDKTNISSVIHFSYPINILYDKTLEKTVEKDHYIKINFPSKYPTISSPSFSSNYKSSSLYISKKIHAIKDVDFDGELIIEHIPTTNGFTKLYVCIPLKTVTGYHNSIDNIIQDKQNMEINMNNLLPISSTGILYSSTIFPFETSFSDKVLLFTEPISVGTSFLSFQKVDLFTPFSNYPTFISIEKHDVQEIEGFQEGLTTANLYCQPVDINDASNNDVLTVALPTGKPTEYDSTKQILSLSQNFMVFFVIILGIFGLSPYGYDLIIGLINKADILLGTNLKPNEKAGKLYGFDILFSIIFFLMAISLMYMGIGNNDSKKITIGFFLFLTFIFIFIRIQIYKNLSYSGGFVEFINTKFFNPKNPNLKMTETDLISPDFYGLLVGSVGTIIERNQIFTFIITIIICSVIAKFAGWLDNGGTVITILYIIFLIISFLVTYIAAIYTKKSTDPVE